MSFDKALGTEEARALLRLAAERQERRPDPLKRLLDDEFEKTLWEYDHSQTEPRIPGNLHEKQQEFLESDATDRFLFWANQAGKAQPVDEPVLTPDGWLPMGDIEPGDTVIGGEGTPTTVRSVHPQGEREVFRVVFDDGSSTRCTEDHLWRVMDPSARFKKPGRDRGDGYTRKAERYRQWSVLSLREMRERWGDEPDQTRRCTIPVPDPVQLPERDLPVDPYLLGVLIGDGSLASDNSVEVSTADEAIRESVQRYSPGAPDLNEVADRHYHIAYGSTRDPDTGRYTSENPLLNRLRDLELMGCRSHEKFVPEAYRHASPDQRLSLLQGLMDTDGTVAKNGHVSFTTVSKTLADHVREIVRLHGGKAPMSSRVTTYTYDGEKREGRPSYRVRIRLPETQLFRLTRKQKRVRRPTSTCDERVLHRIEPVGRAECKCITVAHEDGTYVTRDGVVTHNSSIGAIETDLLALGRHPYHQFAEPPLHLWASALTWDMWETVLLPELLTWLPPDRILDAPPAHTKSTKRTILIRADNGKVSRITGKSAEQGRKKYQSARIHGVWLDEEHPESIWDELQMRLARHGGRTWGTMTPLMGMTWVYERVYQPWKEGNRPQTYCSHAGLADNPSIPDEQVEKLEREYEGSPAQLAARLHGKFARPTGLALNYHPGKHQQSWNESTLREKAREQEWPFYGGIDFGAWRFAFVLSTVDRAGRMHVIEEFFSQPKGGDEPTLDERAREIDRLLQKYDAPENTYIWGDEANRTDITEINEAFKRLDSPYRVVAVEHDNKIRSASVTRLNNLFGRRQLLIRRDLGDNQSWQLGQDSQSEGRTVMGSRLKWEMKNWAYPEPGRKRSQSTDRAQKQDPDDDTADGADMIDAMRYMVMSWWSGAEYEGREDRRREKNRDWGLEERIEELNQMQERRDRERAARITGGARGSLSGRRGRRTG